MPHGWWAKCTLPLRTAGEAGTAPYADSGVHRLSAHRVRRGLVGLTVIG